MQERETNPKAGENVRDFNRVAYVMECTTGFTGYDDRMPFQNGMLSEMLLEHGYNTLVSWTQTRHEQSGKEKPHDLDRD